MIGTLWRVRLFGQLSGRGETPFICTLLTYVTPKIGGTVGYDTKDVVS